MNTYGKLWLVALVAVSLSASIARAEGAPPAVARLEVFPADVRLSSARDRQSFVVTATRPDGVTLDVTGEAEYTLADEGIAHREAHVLLPVKDGETSLTVRYAGHEVKLPIAVTGAATHPDISFRLDVMPVFMRAGCNTGS